MYFANEVNSAFAENAPVLLKKGELGGACAVRRSGRERRDTGNRPALSGKGVSAGHAFFDGVPLCCGTGGER